MATDLTVEEVLGRVATLDRKVDEITASMRQDTQEAYRQLQTLQGGSGAAEPLSLISGWKLNSGYTDANLTGATTFVAQGQMLLAGHNITFTRPAHTPFLQIDMIAGFACYDYVICTDGCGTHTTVRAMMADFITAAEASPGVTKSCWLCSDDQDMNIEFGSANGNVSSATLSIEGAGSVHESNANAVTPRHTLTAGPAASMVNGSAYFKTTNPYRPRLIYRNVRLWAKYTTDANTISFHNASGGAGANRMMVALYDCDLHIGGSGGADASSANAVICDGDTNGAGNGAELYLNNCRGNVGGLIRFHINNSAGDVEVDNCRISMFSLGSDITVSTLGNVIFRGGTITTTGYLLYVNGSGGHTLTIQGTSFRHTGATVWLRHVGGSTSPNTRIYIEGVDYSQSSTTLGAVTISPSASGSNHTLFIDSCSFASDSANAATAVVVTGTNWLSSQIGNVAAPNFAATSSGIGSWLPSLVIGGPGSTTPTPGSIIDIISPVGAGAGLTVLMPRFPTTARPASPTSGMLYYDSTLNRFVGYENSVWATVVTNEGEGLKYPLLLGRGSPAGNIFTGYASWGTDVGASGYSTTLLAFTPGGYWRMGEAAGQPQDSSGNANHTTVTGGTPTYSQTGALSGDANTAILLNGSTGYFSAPDAATIDPADTFTVMGWVKKAANGTVMCILSKGADAFELRFAADNKLELLKENVASIVKSTTTITDTSYHFVVATKSGATVKLYIDNVDVTGTVTNATCATNAALLSIGRRSTAADEFFNGTIDEVAVFPTALSAANINSLYMAGTASAPAPLLTSDGAITGLFLNIGNLAQTAGVESQITGDGTYSGYLRVGSNAAPTITTAGAVTTGSLYIVDASGFSLTQGASLSSINFDTGDSLVYNQAANRFGFQIASVQYGAIEPVGDSATWYAGTPNSTAKRGILYACGNKTDPGILILESHNGTDQYKRMDAYGNQFRFLDVVGTEYAHLGPTWLRAVGYARIGSLTAPTNVTAGDLTIERLFVGNASLDSEARLAQVIDTYTPGAGAFNSLYVQTNASPGAGVASDEVRAAKFETNVRPTANYAGTVTGFYAEADHDSGAFDVAAMQGFFGQVFQRVAATTISTGRAGHLAYRITAGAFTTAIGLDILRGIAGDAGTITTGIGIRIAASAGVVPGTDIAIQSLGGHHRFVGGLNLGTDAAPAAAHLLDIHGAVALDNGSSLDWRDSGATLRSTFYLGGDNEMNAMVAGGAGKHFRILNQAQSASLWQITNAGVQDSNQLYANGGILQWQDSAAATRSVLQLASDNYVNIFNAGGAGLKVRILNQAGSAELWGIDNDGTMNVSKQTLGGVVQQLSSIATNDDPTEFIYQNRVATTDATVTTLHTFTIPASTTYRIVAQVVARRTGGAAGTAEDGAGYGVTATVKNVAGVATLIGAVAAVDTQEDQAAWDTTITVTGATALLRVTGAAQNDVVWHMTARVYQVST